MRGKNNFAEVSESLARYRFENNFNKLSNYQLITIKIIMKDAQTGC